MSRVYPPKWCEKDDCMSCDFVECDNKFLNILEKYNLKGKKEKIIETTVIAIYYGYCQKLAHFFLQFPTNSPIPIIFDNFVNPVDEQPSRTNIQRILFDMLNHGDPDAPTDEVHKYRLVLNSELFIEIKDYKLMIRGEKDTELLVGPDEKEEILKNAEIYTNNYIEDTLEFNKTEDLTKCKYCFLPVCE